MLLDLKQRGCRGSRAVMVLTATGSGRRGPWRDAGARTGQRRGAATLARSLEPDEADAMARDLARGRRVQAAACPARTWQRRFLAAETTAREIESSERDHQVRERDREGEERDEAGPGRGRWRARLAGSAKSAGRPRARGWIEELGSWARGGCRGRAQSCCRSPTVRRGWPEV